MQSALDFQFAYSGSTLVRIEIGAVEYSDKYVAIDYAVRQGDAHLNAVSVQINHGLEVARRIVPAVDSALGGIGCVSVSGLALFLSMVPSIAPVGASLGGIQQDLVTGKLDLLLFAAISQQIAINCCNFAAFML